MKEEQEQHPDGYCNDPECWCHFDVGYHAIVTEMPPTVTEEEHQQALVFFGVVQSAR